MSKKTEHEHYIEAYPKYRVDINNPANGLGGSDVVTHYAWTDDDAKAIVEFLHQDNQEKALKCAEGGAISVEKGEDVENSSLQRHEHPHTDPI